MQLLLRVYTVCNDNSNLRWQKQLRCRMDVTDFGMYFLVTDLDGDLQKIDTTYFSVASDFFLLLTFVEL